MITPTLRSCVLLCVAMLPTSAQRTTVNPAKMPLLGTVDERFQSYNVEMVEVTGGRFWKPYAAAGAATAENRTGAASPAGLDPNLFEYRPPLDLSTAKLRKLAAALGPAYVRVSGTWANNIYFHDGDGPAPEEPPAGFSAVLTKQQWQGVLDFTRAVNGKLMTSFAFGAGTRDGEGAWTSAQARRFVAATKAAGADIAVAEFVNEPNFGMMAGAPKGYTPAAFARDLGIFRSFLKEASPATVLLGPGSVAEGGAIQARIPGRMKTEDLLAATGPAFDAFSYHVYLAGSKRCGGGSPDVLSADWLSQPEKVSDFYSGLRDRYAPGKALWITETADAACGGNPWAKTFADSFRYLQQHGRLAQKGVQVIAHNTLAASDYGLLDEHTFAPRPNYWAALLWRRLMGGAVLEPGVRGAADVYVYAHCAPAGSKGVTVLAINAGKTAREFDAAAKGERYTLTAAELESQTVRLNGGVLRAGEDGTLPAMAGARFQAGRVELPPTSVTFLAFGGVKNAACGK